MADPSPSHDDRDVAQEPDMEWPDRNRGLLVREVRDRVETDLLYENSLQRYIIKRLRSAGTGQRTSRDRW